MPEDVIRRRFVAGLKNFQQLYKGAVDDWVLYDNTDPEPVALEWGQTQ